MVFAGEDQGPSEVDNAREWESFENISDPSDGGDGQHHPDRIPQLIIHFSPPVVGGIIDIAIQVTDTIIDDSTGVAFAVSSDDAEQENDAIDALFDDDIDAGWEGAPEDQNILTAGMRFRGLMIPAGATIDSAFVTVNSHEGKDAEDVARITIYGDASDDAQTFTEDALITDRPATNANEVWEVNTIWDLWGDYRTPDLKAIVQEIVDRDGWQPGNAIAFVFAGEDQGPSEVDNAREWESFENISDPSDGGDGQHHPERVPRLRVYFSGGTTSAIDLTNNVKTLIVYPNPARQDYVTLELGNDKPSVIQVYNLAGQLLRSTSYDHGKSFQYYIGELRTGLYLLKGIQENDVYLQKIQIED